MNVCRVAVLLAMLQVSCAAAPNEDPAAAGAAGSIPGTDHQLFPVAIVFEPALTATGTLSVRHESGWSLDTAAPPSGVDLDMPEGPANLLLIVGERQFERTIKVAPSSDGKALGCVWRLSP